MKAAAGRSIVTEKKKQTDPSKFIVPTYKWKLRRWQWPFLNVDGIKFVINFDYPNNSEDYIHRIGRTGRSDTLGSSFTFFTKQNARQAKDLISVLHEANQVSIFNLKIKDKVHTVPIIIWF